MKKIIVLSQDHPDIGLEEVRILTKQEPQVIGTLAIVDTEERLFNRLAYAHKVLEFLFVCDENKIEQMVKAFVWDDVYEDSYYVNVHGNTEGGKKLADLIWDRIKNPKVDVKYAKTVIEFSFEEGKVVCGKFLYECDKSYTLRKSHLGPSQHGTALDPRLARALVNISGIVHGETLADPFCGTGGIVIEAGLMRFKTICNDFDQDMQVKAQRNLEHYKVRHFKMESLDSSKDIAKAEVVVTDLPYGKQSKVSAELHVVYEGFLEKSFDIIGKRMIVVFPHFYDYKATIKQLKKWKIVKEFDFFVHKSLTRKIVVLEK